MTSATLPARTRFLIVYGIAGEREGRKLVGCLAKGRRRYIVASVLRSNRVS